MGIEEGEIDVGGTRVFYRHRDAAGTPALFVHGNPTSSAQWLPFMERLDGPVLALDIPGWGRSERPSPETFDYGMHGLAAVVEAFLERLGVERYRLVAQDWGAGFALIAAQRRPAAVERLVLMDAVPLLSGYRWHRSARIWRARGVGESAQALLNRPAAALALREARAGHQRMPEEFLEMAWSNLGDRVTSRAILALYRSADPSALAAAGSRLSQIVCPALILWGKQDPYIPARFAAAYADALGGPAEVEILSDAGHWPWLDRPDVVDRVVGFLEEKQGLASPP